MEEYMQDLNKILSTDVTKLYNEKPCIDSGWVLSFEKLLTHLRQLCNLDESSRSNFMSAKMAERIYKYRNPRIVLLLWFPETLVI